jgi:hypothetical protein
MRSVCGGDIAGLYRTKLLNLLLNDELIERKTKEMDSRNEGEAIIMEFCHPGT